MKRRSGIPFMAGMMIVLAGFSSISCTKTADPMKLEKLRVGLLPDFYNALLYIAQQQGMFKRHGLDLTIENYQTGALAVDDLQAGNVDLATASEFVLALRTFKRPDLRAVASISASDTIEMIARRDCGIETVADLKGKRVGYNTSANSEFFLSTFLSLNCIRSEAIQRVALKPSEIGPALVAGKIDAAVALLSFFDEAKRELGDRAVTWPAQGGQDFFGLLITRDDIIRAKPAAISGLLKGLLEAETFLKRHEKEALDIVKRELKIDPKADIPASSRTRLLVRLDQELLTLMEDEARWAIRNNLIEDESAPNYFLSFYLNGLEQLKPGAVSVIH